MLRRPRQSLLEQHVFNCRNIRPSMWQDFSLLARRWDLSPYSGLAIATLLSRLVVHTCRCLLGVTSLPVSIEATRDWYTAKGRLGGSLWPTKLPRSFPYMTGRNKHNWWVRQKETKAVKRECRRASAIPNSMDGGQALPLNIPLLRH